MKKKSIFLNFATLTILTAIVIVSGIIVAIFLSNPEKSLSHFGYKDTFKDLKKLEDIQLIVPTSIYDDNGNLIREFAIEKRKIAKQSEIPLILKQALISAEDKNFYNHWGINIKGLMRAITGQIFNENRGGGSSITQQLVLNLFLKREITYARKLKEMLLAIQIERNYTKDEIITYYCNKIFFGKDIYGVKSAYRYYFRKNLDGISIDIANSGLTADEIKKIKESPSFKIANIADAAFIAGIIPSPNNIYDLEKNPDNCFRKRNIVLKRMYDNKMISQSEYNAAVKLKLPQISKSVVTGAEQLGSYFMEEVRKRIESKFGGNTLYKDGLKVYTTINMKMQGWAEASLKMGLRQLDKRRGWKSGYTLRNLIKEGKKTDEVSLNSWNYHFLKKGKIIEGIITKINSKRAIVRIGELTAILREKNARWTKNYINRILKKGDISLFKIKSLPKVFAKAPYSTLPISELKKPGKKTSLIELSLERDPEPEAAIVIIENRTGKIKALSGGYSFVKSKWNNAVQGKRQVGSTVKPLIYTAALQNGYTPSTIIDDEPYSYEGPWADGIWEPHNHGDEYVGPITFRRALEKSKNVVTARITARLTPERVLSYTRRFGIGASWKPYISIALGSFEATPLEMTAAYTVFPNLGYRVSPLFITKVSERNNNVIERGEVEKRRVIDPASAFVMNYIMQGVVQSGTGFRARALANEYKVKIGAKTGTTNDYTNAWFIGFTPKITIGVWVGYDKKLQSLGKDETGSRAAGPIFVEFLKQYLIDKYGEGEEKKLPVNYTKPPGVIMVWIDKYTGKLKTQSCLYPFLEAYLAGKEPTELCSDEEHDKITDYYGDDSEVEEE